MRVTCTSSIWYCSTTVVPPAVAGLQPLAHLVEPVAVVDGLQDGGVGAEQRLVLELQVLGQGQDDLAARLPR